MSRNNSNIKNMEYKIENLEGPFGYRREGFGIVVYLFNSKVDYDAVRKVTDIYYDEIIEDEDGEEIVDFSEYDPSCLYSEMAGELVDKLSMEEIVGKIKGDFDDIKKFKQFLWQDVVKQRYPLIFVDSKNKTISQILELDELNRTVELYQDKLSIYLGEYDHNHDY